MGRILEPSAIREQLRVGATLIDRSRRLGDAEIDISTAARVHRASVQDETLPASDVTIHKTIMYRNTLGHGTIHYTLSLCILSSRYILKLSLIYENSHRIVKLFANTPN